MHGRFSLPRNSEKRKKPYEIRIIERSSGIRGEELRAILSKAKLRPTRHRILLARLLFGQPQRHVTADSLHAEACETGAKISVATVYNTLEQFGAAGLVRRVAVPGNRSYFDTDAGDHQHFYIEGEGRIIDMPPGAVEICGVTEPPDGYEINKVDILVCLRRKD